MYFEVDDVIAMSVFANSNLFYRISKAVFDLNGVKEAGYFNQNAFDMSVSKDYEYSVDGREYSLFIDRHDRQPHRTLHPLEPTTKKVARMIFSVPGLFIFLCEYDMVYMNDTTEHHVIIDDFKMSHVYFVSGASTATIDHHIMMLALLLDLS